MEFISTVSGNLFWAEISPFFTSLLYFSIPAMMGIADALLSMESQTYLLGMFFLLCALFFQRIHHL